MKKRIVTISLENTYVFNEKEFSFKNYSDEELKEIAYEWWAECAPTIGLNTVEEE